MRTAPNESSYSLYTAVTGCNAQVLRLLIEPCEKSDEASKLTIGDLVNEIQKYDMANQSTGHLHSSPNPYILKGLKNRKFVWLRTDRVEKSLVALYTGPYKIVKRNNKHFPIATAEVNGNVSIDILKPAIVSFPSSFSLLRI